MEIDDLRTGGQRGGIAQDGKGREHTLSLSFDFARMVLSWETEVRCVMLIVVSTERLKLLVRNWEPESRVRVH